MKHDQHAFTLKQQKLLNTCYHILSKVLQLLKPVFRRLGSRRSQGIILPIEKLTKEAMFRSKSCGQCVLQFTGMVCPMNCPKELRNGPCGGVRQDGYCEVNPDMICVWLLAWNGNHLGKDGDFPIQTRLPPVDRRLVGTSAWLSDLWNESGQR